MKNKKDILETKTESETEAATDPNPRSSIFNSASGPKGKIARLPAAIRESVNQWITDAVPFDTISQRLAELGITLPEAASPSFNYVPVALHRGIAYVAGQLPKVDGEVKVQGKAGDTVSPDVARAEARICILQGLACLRQALGTLDRIERVLKVTGFVASAPGFVAQPGVLNGASELLAAIFGDSGRHARSAVGVVALPMGAPVEVELRLAQIRKGLGELGIRAGDLLLIVALANDGQGSPSGNDVTFLADLGTRAEVDTSGFTELESRTVDGHRWWTLDELRATEETIYPVQLPTLLPKALTSTWDGTVRTVR